MTGSDAAVLAAENPVNCRKGVEYAAGFAARAGVDVDRAATPLWGAMNLNRWRDDGVATRDVTRDARWAVLMREGGA